MTGTEVRMVSGDFVFVCDCKQFSEIKNALKHKQVKVVQLPEITP